MAKGKAPVVPADLNDLYAIPKPLHDKDQAATYAIERRDEMTSAEDAAAEWFAGPELTDAVANDRHNYLPAVAATMRVYDRMIAAHKAQAARHTAAAKLAENKRDGLYVAVTKAMLDGKCPRIDTVNGDRMVLGKSPPALVIEDEKKAIETWVPKVFTQTTTTIDKAGLKAAVIADPTMFPHAKIERSDILTVTHGPA